MQIQLISEISTATQLLIELLDETDCNWVEQESAGDGKKYKILDPDDMDLNLKINNFEIIAHMAKQLIPHICNSSLINPNVPFVGTNNSKSCIETIIIKLSAKKNLLLGSADADDIQVERINELYDSIVGKIPEEFEDDGVENDSMGSDEEPIKDPMVID